MSIQQNPQSSTSDLPILYSYHNCPYCVRARLALVAGNIPVRLREVALPNKPAELLEVSPKGTVPVLVLADGTVIDESPDVVDWAIRQSDPMGLGDHNASQADIDLLLEGNTRLTKALVRRKYPERFKDDGDTTDWDAEAESFLKTLENRLGFASYLVSDHATRIDVLIVPFVAQYHAFRPLSSEQFPHLTVWLEGFFASDLHARAMQEYAAWESGQLEPIFP